jgi:hypothetical protein
MAQTMECLPSKHKALSSIPNTKRKEGKKRRRKKGRKEERVEGEKERN